MEESNKYYDGAIVKVEDVVRDFNLSSRNDYLKVTHYYSKDGSLHASVYDGAETSLIERMD